MLLLHDGGIVLGHPVGRVHFARAYVPTSRENCLDFFDGLLLLHVRLSQSLQDSLLIALQPFRLAVFRPNLYYLLLYGFIFLLAHGGPLFRSQLVLFLPDPLLICFDLLLSLL